MDSWTRSYLAALLALGSIQTFAQDALFCGGFELAPLSPTNVVLSVDESEREMLVIWDAPLGNLPDYYEVQGSTMLAGTSFWQDDRVWFSPAFIEMQAFQIPVSSQTGEGRRFRVRSLNISCDLMSEPSDWSNEEFLILD